MNFDLYPFEFLRFRRFLFITPLVQVAAVATLYAITTLGFARQFHATGKMDGYPPDVWILFVPVTEEILFRSLILSAAEIAYGKWQAIVLSSLLFGLWHLKNIFWMSNADLIEQMLYTGFVFGPAMAAITLQTRTIWPAVALHYINNLPSALA